MFIQIVSAIGHFTTPSSFKFGLTIAVQICVFFNDAAFIWSQEEPRNQGAWSFVSPRFRNLVGRQVIEHVVAMFRFISEAQNTYFFFLFLMYLLLRMVN